MNKMVKGKVRGGNMYGEGLLRNLFLGWVREGCHFIVQFGSDVIQKDPGRAKHFSNSLWKNK